MKPNSKRVKALHLIDGFGAGGAETWLIQVARYIKRRPELGLQIDFLVTGGKQSAYDEAVLQTGANIFYIKYSISKFLSFRKAFSVLLKQENYDVIHDHQDFISGWHFLFGIGYLPGKRISHVHNHHDFVSNYVTSLSRLVSFRVGRLLMAMLATKITGTSNAVMDEYGYNKWPYRKKRALPVYCGFDVEKFKYRANAKKELCLEMGWNAETIKVGLFLGRIGLHDFDKERNQKNPEFALSIAIKLVSEYDGWKFIFVGYKGMLGEKMEATVKADGLGDKVKFLGIRNDIPEIMSAATALVFPSLGEGLGMIAVEAQASGLPVIMSDKVPDESIVINELVVIRKLDDSASKWVHAINDVANQNFDRYTFASVIAGSSFSIDLSTTNLLELYS